MTTRFHNLIFDLDGTLVDSLAGIEASIRHAAGGRQLPPLRAQIGPPIAQMFWRMWPTLTETEHANLLKAFREHYDTEGCRDACLYPGVEETLKHLRKRGAILFVVTNKPIFPTRLILQGRGILHLFHDVISPDKRSPPFASKAEAVRVLRDQYQLNPAATAVVGDGLDDREAAAAAGFAFILASYGYGSAAGEGNAGALATLNSFSELVSLPLPQRSQ